MAATERLTRAELRSCQQIQWHRQQRPLGAAARSMSLAVRRGRGAPAAALPPVSLQLMASPFEQMDRQFAEVDRQFADMQRQMDRDMDMAFRDMDRAMDRSFREVQRLQEQIDAEVARSVREAQQQQPGIRVERSEQRGSYGYRYYESIEIRSGPMTALVPSHAAAPAPALFSPLLIAALALGAAWAAVTALFARNYGLTLFSESARWRLLLGWPVLAAFSGKFRGQMASALRGKQVKVTREEGREGEADGGSS